jgi:hypothetical protein
MDNISFVPVPAALDNALEEVSLDNENEQVRVERTDSEFDL